MFRTWIIVAVALAAGCTSNHQQQTQSTMWGSKDISPNAINYPALNQLGWRLGCQAYTFRAMTLFETLDTLKKLDIHYVEMFPGQRLSPEHPLLKADHNMPPDLIELLKTKLKQTNITAVSYGVVGLPNDEKEARKVFDFAKSMGLETIVSEPPEDAFEMLDRLANEYRINVAIHDHPKPSHYWDCDLVLKVCQGRSSRIGACADVGHWYRSGLVPVDCLHKLQGRIIELHFKDLSPEKKDVPWGTGQCNMPAMLDELHHQHFQGVFNVEYESTTGQELFDNVNKSIHFFSDYATKLAAQ